MGMFKIFNEHYYFDLDEIDNYIKIDPVVPRPISGGTTDEEEILYTEANHISVVKYETIKLMMDIVMDEKELTDDSLGMKTSNISLPFKFAFNTLLSKQLLKSF